MLTPVTRSSQQAVFSSACPLLIQAAQIQYEFFLWYTVVHKLDDDKNR